MAMLVNPATATLALVHDGNVTDPLLESFFSLMYGCELKPTSSEPVENDENCNSYALEKQWSSDSG